MFERKPVKSYKEGREKLYKLLEENMETEYLQIYPWEREDLAVDILLNNGNAYIVGNDKFKNILEKVAFDRVYNAKSNDGYKKAFKRAYEQGKTAVRSNGNLSINTGITGVMGPVYDPDRQSNGYGTYRQTYFKTEDIISILGHISVEIKNKEKYLSIRNLSEELFYLEDNSIELEEDELEDISADEYSKNKIIFGPPGTGKSYNIKDKLNIINVKDENTIRITFHPEYSYYEFIGQYKPVVGYEQVGNKIIYPNSDISPNKKAFVYYDFVPGPFTKSIIKALKLREESLEDEIEDNALLIIEEINRGNSSAIFGDIFQLLDRINDSSEKNYGESEYSIDISEEMKNYIMKELKWDNDKWDENFPRGFVIPKNLYIYASMNTSDQSLYPMDSAFKRRWDMEYMHIDYEEEKLDGFNLPYPYEDIRWLDFISIINRQIVDYTNVDDKQIGQWFVGHSLTEDEFLGKVIAYLWFDIFRYDPKKIFKDSIKTFDDIRKDYNKGVFKSELIKEMRDGENIELEVNENEEL